MGFLPKGFEWIIILVVVLIIFGPKNLPKLGKSLGATVKNLREGMSGDEPASDEAPVEEESEEDTRIRELEAQLAEAKKQKEDKEQASE